MSEKILILDFGSQYTQLIARRVRELNIYCEIYPFNHFPEPDDSVKGIILSGSPFSVHDINAPQIDFKKLLGKFPVLAVCYGSQLIASTLGGKVVKSLKREYGRAHLNILSNQDLLFKDIDNLAQVWMSHADTVIEIPKQFELIAKTDSIEIAAYKSVVGAFTLPVYCIQFHPEVTHTICGKQLLENFCVSICGCTCNWTPTSFIKESIASIRNQVGHGKVVLALSGGVDSTVAATIIHQAIGKNLYCIFVDNGLLRFGEYETVLKDYEQMGLNIKGVDAKNIFLSELNGVTDPETKRKIIGKLFIEVFDREAHLLKDISWLAQGTIYPDVIESVSVNGPSATIKSHHNVGGLPEKMNLKILEPLRLLFKDEVRRVGKELKVPADILNRHPFPGPGLAIRIISDITTEKVLMLQKADKIFTDHLKQSGLYNSVWQAGAILLPVQSVGVMGDERTYENVIALRCVNSTDGMTADWSHLPHDFLAKVSSEIINHVKGINRVVYDISSKPPATIEWE